MMSRLYPRRRPQATTREGSYHDVEHMVSSPVEVGGIERVWAGTQPTLGLNEREIYWRRMTLTMRKMGVGWLSLDRLPDIELDRSLCHWCFKLEEEWRPLVVTDVCYVTHFLAINVCQVTDRETKWCLTCNLIAKETDVIMWYLNGNQYGINLITSTWIWTFCIIEFWQKIVYLLQKWSWTISFGILFQTFSLWMLVWCLTKCNLIQSTVKIPFQLLQ